MNYPIPVPPQIVAPIAFSALDQNPAAVYLATRLTSEKSRRTQRGALETIARLVSQEQQGFLELPWAALRYQHTAAIRAALASRYAPATANRMLSALRGVLEEAWRLELMTAEEFRRSADVKNIKSEQLPSGRALDGSEVIALMQACIQDLSPAGIRDAAMLGILRSGLRRFEVVNLDLSDIDLGDGGLKVRSGKGRKDRMVYLNEGAIAALKHWLEVRGFEVGALLHPINKSGKITQRRLSDEAVRVILEKRIVQAKVAHLSAHDWRRTFVSDLLDAGVDVSTVQQLTGHASPVTVVRYDRRGEVAKRKAIGLLK